ncbi:MAG: hypothetical protein HZB65_03805 [Candidatus Aenigmarchaeota archaeon]|nr:hypothetical protein [Candidatus Aenigmarchaeota archaeon]
MLLLILASIVILLVINVFYRILINQDEVLNIKDRIKKLEDESKEHKDNPDKTKEYFSKMMNENGKLTKLTLKPMIVSFMIVLIALPLLSMLYADYNIPLENNAGNATIENQMYFAEIQNNSITLTKDGQMVFSADLPFVQEINGRQYKIEMKEGRVNMMRVIAVTPITLPFIGRELSWIFLYIILSIPLSILLKKLLGVRI